MLAEAKGVSSHLLIGLALLALEKELLPQLRMTEFLSIAKMILTTGKIIFTYLLMTISTK